MADKKISALTAATTPLAGTEVLPIVQSGTTVKVSVDNLTAGKAVSTGIVTSTATTGSQAIYTGWSPTGGAHPANGSVDFGTAAGNKGIVSYDSTGAFPGALYIENTYNDGNASTRIRLRGVDRIIAKGNGDVSIASGNVVMDTAGKGITTSVTNGNVNLIPNGSGIVASDNGHSFNKIASRRVSKAVAQSGTAVLTVTPVSTTSTHLAVRIDINVAFTNSTNLQYHAGYLVLTCDQTTNGGGTAIAEYYNGTVGNFVVATTDFVVTRPGSGQLVVTYTNNNGADSNNIEFAVTGVFDAATIA